jgi:ubiquinone/menaquinone biosynthesis C-methylase UbiE
VSREEVAATRPRTVFAGTPDEVWFWLNTEGRRLCPALAVLLPSVPDEGLQSAFVGLSGDAALQHGFDIYRLFKSLYETHSGPLDGSTRVLDFGCGWGRVIRFFLREVDPENLWGIDVSDDAIAACQQTNRWATFATSPRFAPSLLPDRTFDLVYAYSVFSHLSERCHETWIADFERILKPNGLLLVTTRPREFIERCAELRRADPAARPTWHAAAAMFQDVDAALKAYDAGQYCYDTNFRNPDFGHACIPEQYVREKWATHLDIVDFITDRGLDEQNIVVARSRAVPSD